MPVKVLESDNSRRTVGYWGKVFLIGATIAICPLSHSAGLMTVYQLALQNDPLYLAAKMERKANSHQSELARAGLLPKASYQYETNRNSSTVTQRDYFGRQTATNRTYNGYSSRLLIQQPIFDWREISNYRRGIDRVLVSDSEFLERHQDVAIRVFQGYVGALYAADRLDLAHAQKASYLQQLRVNKNKLLAGESTQTDVVETQARLDLTVAQEAEAADDMDAALKNLDSITGREWKIEELSPLRGTFPLSELEPSSFDEWKSFALRANPAVRALEYSINAAGEEIEIARAGHMPKVSLYASMSRNRSSSDSTYGQEHSGSAIGLQLEIPLYAGGGVSADIARATDQQSRVRYDRDAKQAEVITELRRQFNQVKSGPTKIRALELAVDAGRQVILAMRLSVEGGERTNTDVLDAEQRYYRALADLAEARYTYLLSWLRLKKYAGTLSAQDLATVSDYFSSTH